MTKFKQYVHKKLDDFTYYESILRQCGVDIPDYYDDYENWHSFMFDWAKKIGDPFFELELECDLDLETGDVTILGVK